MKNKLDDTKYEKKSFSNDNTSIIRKSKSFSVNKNRINNLALKYSILNYDISYRVETYRIYLSDLDEKKIKNLYNNMNISLIDQIKDFESSGTVKANQMAIENNYFDKYNMLKTYFG